MTEPRMTGNKICSRCEKERPVICFAVNKKSPDGLAYWCRDCGSENKEKGHLPNRMQGNHLRKYKLARFTPDNEKNR